MESSMELLPKRLIICVDGTWCNPDGTRSKCRNQTLDSAGGQRSNLTNVYQIYISLKRGKCIDSRTGKTFNQCAMYIDGLASAAEFSVTQRAWAGYSGSGYEKQIREAYEECCKLRNEGDEVWLYGFSRGAFVVRAVAGMLHYLRAIESAGTETFRTDYKRALEVYKAMQKQGKLGPGQIHRYLAAETRPAPNIQFVGVFDTVKAVADQCLFDISLNDSIQHLRHALALHESRSYMSPEYLWPEANHAGNALGKRSFVQAWFVGAHIDMGGSADNAGLALYPLQWMLLESLAKGLQLEFTGNFQGRASVDNPLEVIFPSTSDLGRNGDPHTYATKNDIKVEMHDLRKVHKLERYGTRYNIKVNRHGPFSSFVASARQPFDPDGNLNGYFSFAPQGTIIHPSVYYLLDDSPLVSFSSKEVGLQNKLEKVRFKMLGKDGECWNQGFWNDGETAAMEDLPALRILVCGNTGVGKSTLISRVFGVASEATGVSTREAGKHNIRTPITFRERPDLIVHDSCGFEAGTDEEMKAVESFLQEKSSETDLAQRIHAVWFCLEVGDPRPKQSSTLKLFHLVAKYVKEVPLVVVATKKDQLFNMAYGERRMSLRKQGLVLDDEEIEAYAQKEVEEHVKLIEKEMHEEVPEGRMDACLAVAHDDDESIDELTKVTAQCFSSEKVRLMYVRSQTKRIDLKIDLAIDEVMGQYRKILKSATGTSFVPLGPSANRLAAATAVCRTVITCFGLPTVNAETAFRLIINNARDDLGHNCTVAFAEALSTIGLIMTIGAGGLPVFLATGVLNLPLVVPATTRLFLMLGCDLILILARSFQAASEQCIGQPLEGDLSKAARAYRPIAKDVHAAIAKAVPRRNLLKSYRVDKVRQWFHEVIDQYRPIFVASKATTTCPVPAFTPRKVVVAGHDSHNGHISHDDHSSHDGHISHVGHHDDSELESDTDTNSTDATTLEGLEEDIKEIHAKATPVLSTSLQSSG